MKTRKCANKFLNSFQFLRILFTTIAREVVDIALRSFH